MTKYEKVMITILSLTILITTLSLIVLTFKEMLPVNNLFSTYVLGPTIGIITGLISGQYLTSYYRKRDRRERISTALYGLQVHLKKISYTLTDLREAIEIADELKTERAIDKLKNVMADEPYTLVLELDSPYIDENALEARSKAFQIIAAIEDRVIYEKNEISMKEIMIWKHLLLSERMELMKKRRQNLR